jgi:hypothetical protein
MNTKETVLIIVIIILAGLNYYLYSNLKVCNNTAKELGNNLQDCIGAATEAKSGLEQCMVDFVKCRNNIE